MIMIVIRIAINYVAIVGGLAPHGAFVEVNQASKAGLGDADLLQRVAEFFGAHFAHCLKFAFSASGRGGCRGTRDCRTRLRACAGASHAGCRTQTALLPGAVSPHSGQRWRPASIVSLTSLYRWSVRSVETKVVHRLSEYRICKGTRINEVLAFAVPIMRALVTGFLRCSKTALTRHGSKLRSAKAPAAPMSLMAKFRAATPS
ncbi:hypothetical protein [Bradyrhizobium sp. sBnM-33]|uniref:hypothetical protein n=1 Tax=Bradyrhizobium sp. sBnM-33 TaxID=2831780 RepID=UPI001BCDFFED|nr:hypothetical protein [Bradyrhizobium sp. sBnM-33]WOH53570.1 hypothetical protein RX328_16650 [Bradyrhizobium sp. sBnM-33]